MKARTVLLSVFIFLALLQEFLHAQEMLLEPISPPLLAATFRDQGGIKARIIMWGKQSTFEDQEVILTQAAPIDGCDEHGTKLTGNASVLAVGLNKCPLTNLIFNAQNRGAKALFVANHDDRKVADLVIPNQLPGVQIHVFLIDKSVSDLILNVLNAQNQGPTKLRLSFQKFAQQNSSVNLEITYNPDNMFSSRLLADLYSSPFLSDMNLGKLKIDHKYVILGCTACEEKKYTLQKENCLSGGRYCQRSTRSGDISGEVLLIQILKNHCVEGALKLDFKTKAQYHWLANGVCVKDFNPKCFNKVLTKLGIKDQVFKCINSSFELGPSKSLNIGLNENRVLANYKREFEVVSHFSMFPLIKINGIVFYGEATYKEIMTFVCRHLNSKLGGCATTFGKDTTIDVEAKGSGLKFVIILFVVLGVAGLIEYCRRHLKKRFESQMTYQIDKSVSEYLDRTGGSDL